MNEDDKQIYLAEKKNIKILKKIDKLQNKLNELNDDNT